MLYDLWIVINWILATIGMVYTAKEDNMPMATGWFICSISWLGLMR